MFRFLAIAAAASVSIAPLRSARAAEDAPRCGPDFQWNDFSTLDITVRGQAGKGEPPTAMRAAMTFYDDGQRLVFKADGQRSELVAMNPPTGFPFLASDAQAPLQLAEIGMVLQVPLGTLTQQFRDPCALAPGVRYPLAPMRRQPGVTGELERQGATIRFVIREADEGRQLTHSGTVGYEAVHRRLPADLRIQGWTIFPSSIRPEDGKPSSFETLGAFEDSLKKNATP